MNTRASAIHFETESSTVCAVSAIRERVNLTFNLTQVVGYPIPPATNNKKSCLLAQSLHLPTVSSLEALVTRVSAHRFPVMCYFTTHVSICTFCKTRETILISENMCADAKGSGVFGSCGTTETKTCETSRKCWKCKDDVDEATPLP